MIRKAIKTPTIMEAVGGRKVSKSGLELETYFNINSCYCIFCIVWVWPMYFIFFYYYFLAIEILRREILCARGDKKILKRQLLLDQV